MALIDVERRTTSEAQLRQLAVEMRGLPSDLPFVLNRLNAKHAAIRRCIA